MKVYDYEQLYKEERESHMVTENLYARALRELEELKRQTETSFYQHDNNDGKYEGLLAELETVHKARDELEDKVVDTQRALKECENDVSEMHAKFAEAVVTATQQASRCDVAERAVNRMEAVVSQLEADNSKLRNSKNEELDQYKEDLREVQAEVVLLTSRLRESETSRVQQSACISELTKNELLIDAAKRKCEQDLAAASKEVEKLRTASPQRVLANTDLQLYEAIDHSYSQMKTAVRMCLDMVTSLEQQSALTSSKLEALTVCVFDMSRQDRQLAQVVQNMSATSYAANRSTAEVKELQLENDRLSKLIEQAASQMLSFNEAVSLAEARL